MRIGDACYMTYAFRPFTWSPNPTGVGVAEGTETPFPGFSGHSQDNQNCSGIAVLEDRVHSRDLAWVSHRTSMTMT